MWAEYYRDLPDGSAIPGRYSFAITPYLREIIDACADPRVHRVVCRKSAQVGWTDGVVNNVIGWRIDNNPGRILVLFPREKSAIDFNDEKLEPMINACRRLSDRIQLTSRKAGNRQLFKKFPGGFLKLIASNSPGDVKSTSAPLVVVEEPDDCNQNVRGQGDSIKMAEERLKTYHNALMLVGGTPTIAGVSAIDAEIETSDQRKFHVPCHHCGDAHVLTWENVRWLKDEANPDHVYGKHHPDTAYYVCPHCGATWNDAEKSRNVRRGKWIAGKPFNGVAGFDDLNELYSPFPGSMLVKLVKKYLDALKEFRAGNDKKLVAFWNSSRGRSYEYKSELPHAKDLIERAEDYGSFTVPAQALYLVMGVDVQHDRIAICIWAYGRGMESWLVWWGEEYGTTIDKDGDVWKALDDHMHRTYQHASGAEMFIDAVSIDAGDGQTSDAVYDWVRRHRRGRCRVMAIKGVQNGEIFSQPKQRSIDPGVGTKASKYGIQVYTVGVDKAKDLILGYTAEGGRIKLCDRSADGTITTGRGAGRMHWYKDVRSDFFEQLSESEVKVPNIRAAGKLTWTLKRGKRNEALDCTVYAEHAARAIKLNLLSDAQWLAREKELRAIDLFSKDEEFDATTPLPLPAANAGRFSPTAAIAS